MIMRASLPLLFLLGAISPRLTRAAGSDCSLACLSTDCKIAAGRCLLEAGRAAEAKELLKPLLAADPGNLPLRLLTARAYLALGNTPWTRRTLAEGVARDPRSCELRGFQIWFQLQGGELDAAEEQLAAAGCPGEELGQRGRWQLLDALLARYRKDAEAARAAVERALGERLLFPEDQELLSSLRAAVRPGDRLPLRLRLELGGGYTSNGLMGSPADLAVSGREQASPLLTVDAQLGIEPPWKLRVQPLLELSLRGMILTAEEVSDYTYLNLGLRPGIRLGPIRAFYSGGLFLLHGGDAYQGGPRVFYETHRGELEWEPTPWLTVWGGGGKTIFREAVRTRTETDGGAAVVGSLRRARLLAGISLRSHVASHKAYDLWGGTLITSVTHPLGPLSLRGRFLLGFDLYPRSEKYFGTDESRRDLLLKGALELWSPSWRGLRAGASYEITNRVSSAESYEFVDHRPLLRLSFTLETDPWAPRTIRTGADHVAIPYGVSRSTGLEDERIQDLLRQEDAARRGSTCVN
jgi:hypothetical protein